MPLVSVIVPAYNVAPYLGQCLESVLAQTIADLEVLIVDDGSTDATPAIVAAFKDSRVRLLGDGVNRGRSAARNTAIRAASGKWLALLDADDWWASVRLERLLEIAAAHAANMVADDLAVVRNGESEPYTTVLLERRLRLRQAIPVTVEQVIEWDLGITQPLIQRRLWSEAGIAFDESLRAGEEDFPALLACMLAGARYVLVPDAYYFYRQRPGAATSQRERLFRASHQVTLRLLADPAVQERADVRAALQRRLRHIKQVLAYNQFKRLMLEHRYGAGLRYLLDQPDLVSYLGRRLWHKGWRRGQGL
jgi:succinoglycan biosynthesis protein ExoO